MTELGHVVYLPERRNEGLNTIATQVATARIAGSAYEILATGDDIKAAIERRADVIQRQLLGLPPESQ